MPSIRRVFGKHIPIPIPPELENLAALLHHLGVSDRELKKIWWYRGEMYRSFSIAKGAGKIRVITAPDRRLKILQNKIAHLLGEIYRVRNPVHGFVRGRSIKTNAEAHGKRRFLVNLDLQEFFPTITESRVHGLLNSLGVDDAVSAAISRICCVNNHLPQGAPTSPVISNMICYRLDTELMKYAKESRAIYTRYADDITFSSYQPPVSMFNGITPAAGRFLPTQLAPRLQEIFQTNGFIINPLKAHFADRNSRRIVTGVKINSGLNVDRLYVRRVRALLHSIEMLGLLDAQVKFLAYGGRGNLASHLRGKIAYIAYLKGQTDPVVRTLALRYNNVFSRKINLAPTVEERRGRSVWIVEHSGDGGTQGTAFFLKDVGLVTAAHCVEGATDCYVYHPANRSNKSEVAVLKLCPHRDLAILKHSISGTDYFELDAAAGILNVGDAVSAYGYPDFGPGDKINVRPGLITSLPTKRAVPLVEVAQVLSHGMSGGPILDARGDVVGVIHKGGPEESKQLAVSIDALKELVKS